MAPFEPETSHLVPIIGHTFTSVSLVHTTFILHTSTQYSHPTLYPAARPARELSGTHRQPTPHPPHPHASKHRQPHLRSPANYGQRQPNICSLCPFPAADRRPSRCGNGPSSGLHEEPAAESSYYLAGRRLISHARAHAHARPLPAHARQQGTMLPVWSLTPMMLIRMTGPMVVVAMAAKG